MGGLMLGIPPSCHQNQGKWIGVGGFARGAGEKAVQTDPTCQLHPLPLPAAVLGVQLCAAQQGLLILIAPTFGA